MQRVFEEHKSVIPWLTIDLVKKGLKKTKNDVVVVNNSAISELSNPTFEGSTNQESDALAAPPPMNINITNHHEELPPQTSKPK